MTSGIRLYVEGGGDHRHTKGALKTAFGEFLRETRDRARERGVRWDIIVCGGRNSAWDMFRIALRKHRHATVVLLVDAEGPVSGSDPRQHLHVRDGWTFSGVDERQCHLMVQTMEAWLLADPQQLAEYYGQGFQESALPANQNVEAIDKKKLMAALKRATRGTNKKEYHKTRDAPKILGQIRPAEVKARASSCKRLFQTLNAEIDSS